MCCLVVSSVVDFGQMVLHLLVDHGLESAVWDHAGDLFPFVNQLKVSSHVVLVACDERASRPCLGAFLLLIQVLHFHVGWKDRTLHFIQLIENTTF